MEFLLFMCVLVLLVPILFFLLEVDRRGDRLRMVFYIVVLGFALGMMVTLSIEGVKKYNQEHVHR